MIKKSMNYVLVVLFVFLGILSSIGVRYFQVQHTPGFISTSSSFHLAPPKEALTGIITSVVGSAQILTRESDEFQETSPAATLLQGESVTTLSRSSLELSLTPYATLSLEPLAEIEMVNLLPRTLTLRQKSGKITYTATDPAFPLSVRALQTLCVITGTSTAEIRGNNLIFTVVTGDVQAACIDQNNITQEVSLTAGDVFYLNQYSCL